MNVDRLTKIAEWLEAGAPHKKGVAKFDMSDYVVNDSCGTVCCIAGAACQFFTKSRYKTHQSFVEENAPKILDLSEGEAEELFCAFDLQDEMGFVGLSKITPAWAARCIRKLIATGEVDWRGTREEAK